MKLKCKKTGKRAGNGLLPSKGHPRGGKLREGSKAVRGTKTGGRESGNGKIDRKHPRREERGKK